MTELRAELQSTLGDGDALAQELGGGGMSRLIVARENALGRDAWVKVMSPERSADVSAERFTREITTAVLDRAWPIESRLRLSWWDALIVAAAQSAQCELLLTEELKDGQVFDGVEVVSPFRTPPALGSLAPAHGACRLLA